MTLNLVLATQPPVGTTVIFADPSDPEGLPRAWPSPDCFEPMLAGLVSQLEAQRVMFPLPDETTHRHVAPPSLLRGRHADLWHALSADERARVLLIAGPTAAYLAPVLGPGGSTVVAMRDPKQAITPPRGAWRFVLGPFPELDEVPEECPSAEERDRWLDRIRTATSQFEFVCTTDLGGLTVEVAAGVGLGPKQAARAATIAVSAGGDANGSGRRDRPAHWLDELLYSFSSPPKQQEAPKRRRRSAELSPRPDNSPPPPTRPRKGRRR